MGLLLVGVLAGIMIGFAWLAPSGHLEGCTFQWQGCFDRISAGQPVTPQDTALAPDPLTVQAKPLVRSQAKSEAVQKAAEHSSAERPFAESHRRVALAKDAVQPTRINVPASEHRPAEPLDPVLERAKASIVAKMENPASVKFSDMDRAFRKNTFGRATDTICGHVRGKNASGEDTGERPFLYLVKEDDAYVVDGKPDSAAATAYRNICN
jgi:hypothetical protein